MSVTARRPVVVAWLLALAVVMLAVGRLVWVRASVDTEQGLGARAVELTGTDAVPVFAGLALVVAAAAAALTIAGRGWRFALAVVLTGAAGGALAAAVEVARSPGIAAAPSLASAAGLAQGSLAARDVVAESTPWPWVAGVCAGLATVSGIVLLLTRPRWHAPGRFETPEAVTARSTPVAGRSADADPATDPARAWDSLSRGEDPTDTGRLTQ